MTPPPRSQAKRDFWHLVAFTFFDNLFPSPNNINQTDHLNDQKPDQTIKCGHNIPSESQRTSTLMDIRWTLRQSLYWSQLLARSFLDTGNCPYLIENQLQILDREFGEGMPSEGKRSRCQQPWAGAFADVFTDVFLFARSY